MRGQGDKELYFKIILKTNNIIKTKFNGKFYIILWYSDDKEEYDYILTQATRNNLNIITTKQIFGQYNDPEEKYFIKYDCHPTKLAYYRIAEYLLNNIK
jgi:hypothetical protein